ncbi:uncharacterized protein BX664DRAFT_319353 [Halteromyces radiatus]|uniref:uncharacterized protein n=1 Tax=Halteromyces radiatus TaxID=101107 RepID=UPI002220C0D7|nr:uncharacterized protein BX664DRAFT_319353 [Halteromyces radiatus]KAI8098692.1 hypothetical protein BX664DRAFT_319353 [Halteromyces radiatus]
MTLILTKTCHHALLVAIEEGIGFPSLGDRDLFIHSRLELHLPETVGDLIPPPTIISTKPTKLVSDPQWRTTLVYFLSAKLLRRLRRRQAQVTLQIRAMAEQGDTKEIGLASLRVDQAKIIKMVQGERSLSIVKNYVVDKGEWKPITKEGMSRAQIKAGLFIVDMPPPAGERHRQVATPLRNPIIHNKQMEDELGLEIYSADTSDCLTTNSSSRDTDDDDDDSHQVKQQTPPPTSSLLHHHHHVKKQWINAISTPTSPLSTSPSPTPSLSSTTTSLQVCHRKKDQLTYLQIGNGSQRYSFVLRIVEATAVMSLIPSKLRTLDTRNFLQYTFSEWQVKHHVYTTGNSWQITDPPMCLALQGHLHDLQQWLSHQGQIEICLVLMDKTTQLEHTIGKAMVRLKGWCPLGIQQASFPIHDRSNRLHVDQPYQFARVTIQLGLTEGWGDEDRQEDGSLKRSHSESDDTLVQQQPQYIQIQSKSNSIKY